MTSGLKWEHTLVLQPQISQGRCRFVALERRVSDQCSTDK